MAALTTAPNLNIVKKVWSLPQSWPVCNTRRIWMNAFVGLPGTNAMTSCRGYITEWRDQVNIQWAGVAISQSWTGGLITSIQTNTAANVESVLGDTTLTPVPEMSVETGPTIIESTVAGVSAQSDVWRTLVYSNTDNVSDLSTTASTYAPAIGKVFYWFSSTRCQVFLFGMLRTTNIS